MCQPSRYRRREEEKKTGLIHTNVLGNGMVFQYNIFQYNRKKKKTYYTQENIFDVHDDKRHWETDTLTEQKRNFCLFFFCCCCFSSTAHSLSFVSIYRLKGRNRICATNLCDGKLYNRKIWNNNLNMVCTGRLLEPNFTVDMYNCRPVTIGMSTKKSAYIFVNTTQRKFNRQKLV